MDIASAKQGNNWVLSWKVGTLQSATSATGPWADEPGATSPFTVPLTGPQKFFRLILQQDGADK